MVDPSSLLLPLRRLRDVDGADEEDVLGVLPLDARHLPRAAEVHVAPVRNVSPEALEVRLRAGGPIGTASADSEDVVGRKTLEQGGGGEVVVHGDEHPRAVDLLPQHVALLQQNMKDVASCPAEGAVHERAKLGVTFHPAIHAADQTVARDIARR